MGFQQALSGLSASSTNLDVIGNNIANANTVGFKQGRAEFADMFANALNGGANNQLGLGARVAQIAQQFTQGSVQTTSNPLDTAINGNGFFRVDNAGTVSYSRDGQFQVDKNGYLINSTGARITGYQADSKGNLLRGVPSDLQINSADLAPAATQTAKLQVNLKGNATAPANAFSPTDPTSYNYTTQMQVYDSLGSVHNLSVYYQLQAPPPAAGAATWNVYGVLDQGTANQASVSVTNGVSYTNPAGTVVPKGAGQLSFDSTGTIANPAGSLPFQFSVNLPNSTATSPLNFKFDPSTSTEYGATYSQIAASQDGYAAGQLSGFSIGADGTLQGNYTNGNSLALGQVVLANFADPNGLQAIGNNAWSQTVASGQPLVGAPGSGSLGTLQSSALEQSNVDLTTELVDMITAQRSYQANAETIKTQDQIMQTITSLR